MRGLRLQVKVVSQSSHNPKGRSLAPIAEFLHLAAPNVTLEDLTLLISDKYARLYPRNRPLNIQRLQDSEGNDLDLTYTVGDVFDDKSSSRDGSIVKVIHKDVLRDESVPPESGLRPGSTKKRPIQSLATLEENEETPVEGEEAEEEIGVPVNLHRNKRQKVGSGSEDYTPTAEAQGQSPAEEDGAEEGEPEIPPSFNLVEPAQSQRETMSQDDYVAESSTGRAGLRSPSLGPEIISGAMNHEGLLLPPHLARLEPQERGSSLIPETSQGLGELLSPKEEIFSSPLLTTTGHRRVEPHYQPLELSSAEPEEQEAPVIAPEALRNSGRKSNSATPKQNSGTLKRPNKAITNKRQSLRDQNSIYEIEDSEQSAKEGEDVEPVPQKRKVSRPPLKKPSGPPSKRAPARRSTTASVTPTVEVPCSQTDSGSSQQISRDFVVEVPPIEEIRSRERRPSNISVPNVADLIGSRYRPEEQLVTSTSPLAVKMPQISPPRKNQIQTVRKGSKPPEPAKEPAKEPSKSTSPPAKQNTTSRSSNPPLSATPEVHDKNDGKSAGSSSILRSALRKADEKSLEAKKSVSFANEGSPTPLLAKVKISAVKTDKTPTSATKEANEIRKPRTTFKVPMPVIPPEQQGIGDRSTAEGRKKYDAFVGKPARRSTSSTPPITNITMTPASSKVISKAKTSAEPEKANGEEDGKIVAKKAIAANGQKSYAKKSSTASDEESSDEEEEEDEVMEDAPPLPSGSRTQTSSSPTPSESSESESESESDSEDEDEDEEDSDSEEETNKSPQKTLPAKKNPAMLEVLDSSDSESEPEPEKEFVDIKKIMDLSDSNDEDYVEADGNESGSDTAMTREESPKKGPAKRQLRSTSPEKKTFERISYNSGESNVTLAPVGLSAPGDASSSENSSSDEEVQEDEDQDMVDPPLETPSTKESKVPSKPATKPSTKPAAVTKSQAAEPESESEGESADSDESSGSESESDSEDENTTTTPTNATAPPPSSISVVPESPVATHKPAPVDDSFTSTTNTATTASTSKADSGSSDDSSTDEDESEDEPAKTVLPLSKKVDTTAKAMSALFRSPAPPNLTNGIMRSTPSRVSKTPEPSQQPQQQQSPGLSKLPPSRMNRRTLGYISPSPGPPSSMPARLPSMVTPKDARKRHSLSTHYKGLSALSQQDIPETRDGGKGPAAAAAATTVGNQKSKPRVSIGMQNFESILSSQKGGKDSDDDSSSSDSDDSEEEEKSKDAGKPKGGLGLGRFIPFL